MNYIPISQPSITQKEIDYVTDAVKSGWISSLGEYVENFEKKFCEYCDTKYSLTTANGTVALHLVLAALGINQEDEVIVPDFTFVATANAVKYLGAKVITVDIEEETYCISPKAIEKAITSKTKAIVPVHLYGHPANMDEINKIAKANNVFVIEDAAESHGAEINGKKVGGLGDAAIFSLYGNTKKPTQEMLEGLDVIILDLQDVGVRYYTYVSTMTLVIEAAAEKNIPIWIIDRLNPLGRDIYGPILDSKFASFVGMHPVPISHGMSMGELAIMINEEGWLPDGLKADLKVLQYKGVPTKEDRNLAFRLPPSPNMPDMETAWNYQGLCLLEGTNISEGRGTNKPFKILGAPWMDNVELLKTLSSFLANNDQIDTVSFIPISMPGKSYHPKYENETCHGLKIINLEDPIAFTLHLFKVLVLLHPNEFMFLENNFIDRLYGSDYLRLFLEVMPKYNIEILDKELACAPFKSEEGQAYFKAMACAANMAFANRQVITHQIRKIFSQVFGKTSDEMEMKLVYDVAHNIAKLETYTIDGEEKELLVHRKGATRAFGPARSGDLPEAYQPFGQPVILGGSMETGSYLLVGTDKADETFASTAHGAGRTMSRSAAKRQVDGAELQKDMEKRGIYVHAVTLRGLAEEAGKAYKDIDVVVDTLRKAGITKPVVALKPIGNVKG